MTDLLGGQIDMMITDTATGLPQIKAGKLRALGVSTPKRSPLLPDVPTIDEAGVKGYDMGYWFAAYVPAEHAAAPWSQRLHELLVAGTKSAAAKAFFEPTGTEAFTPRRRSSRSSRRPRRRSGAASIKAAGIEAE